MDRYDRRKHPTLRRGAKGGPVVEMQRRLVRHLVDLREDSFVDGVFGPGTEQRVRRFQRVSRLVVDGIVGRNCWNALLHEPQQRPPSPAGETSATADRTRAAHENKQSAGSGELAARIKRSMKRKGYTFHDDGKPYHLNIVGIRNPSTAINSFDDRVVVIYRDAKGKEQTLQYPITTDPGEYYAQSKLLNKAGAAILVPGQYAGSYKLGKHAGSYAALTQTGGKVTVWRDGNRDDRLDRSGKTYEGYFGVNIHRGNKTGRTNRVGRYSAGCQVFENADHFTVLIDLARKSTGIRANSFSYTLLEEADLK